MLTPVFFDLDQYRSSWAEQDYAVSSGFMAAQHLHLAALYTIVSCAKVYIMDNWQRVEDWSALSVKITDNTSETFYYYKYEPGPEITGTGIIADTFRDFEEWNRDHQMPITLFSNPVLDPSDGDFSVTINDRDHLWIDDNAVIAIAHYIENQAK